MARSKPYRVVQIDMPICDKLVERMNAARYRGSFASFVETVLSQVIDGLLVDRKEVEEEVREEIYAALAADGLIIPAESKRKHERHRKTG